MQLFTLIVAYTHNKQTECYQLNDTLGALLRHVEDLQRPQFKIESLIIIPKKD